MENSGTLFEYHTKNSNLAQTLKTIMMKHLLIICLAAIGFSSLHAQEAFIPINFTALEKKIQKSNTEIADPKKGIDPKIWVKRGELMLSAYEVDLEQVYEGMTPNILLSFYAEPAKSEEVMDDKTYEVYTYPRIKFYFDNGALVMWKKTQFAVENPLNEAFKCFGKATELDKAGKLSLKIYEDYNKLKNHLKKDGINSYYAGNKEAALENFELVLDINKLPALKNTIDTVLIQYSGIIARELGQTERAIQHYKELCKVDNEPNSFILIKEDYLKLKDTVNAISIMEEAFVKYPDTLNIIANLVDLYIRVNRIPEGLTTINGAISHNPEKGELYYWKGRLELNTTEDDRITKALASYDLAVAKNPELYYAYYDIGFIYFLQGQDLFTRSGEEKDKAFREEMIKVGTENYEKAVPNLEKALELNTSNKEIKKETLDTLKRVYYKLQMTEKYDQATELLKNL